MSDFEVTTCTGRVVHQTSDLADAVRAGVEAALRDCPCTISDYDQAGRIVGTVRHDGDLELELDSMSDTVAIHVDELDAHLAERVA